MGNSQFSIVDDREIFDRVNYVVLNLQNETVFTKRQRIKVDLELPMQEEYSNFIRSFVENTIASNK